ncbi:hypothetical protein TVAG_119070 [Trichomonas vaginalis G3]|uniref:DUF3447 domain-containing protein n=1 Tax=Trichomonas vaginalis (strain ATCC PRA-98 / G3) TaxID=412133 RepID=A2D754_TRIV3|nr:protein ubiquitination [Trichomonas vaginalis G3]EAY23571.1 hypothetical protein TVAG_119070 [Trichomonas vaginalis G3]KAI5490068.1 protein ubiquitination [Trichomonas vaginalis G3]|eukprot:XP_001276819.1 hypothetical protein [Trichomonas vaginalis G3]
MALCLIDNLSKIRVKEIELFAELYQKISNEFSFIIKPNNERLATILHYKGLRFENFVAKLTQEEILNLYSTETPLFYIAWDKVDDLKNKFPNLELAKKINDEITPLDCAIKYGSELCFNYLKNIGAKYTYQSIKYAVQGSNTNIFMQMLEEGKSYDKMINTALDNRNYEIAEYLKSHYGQEPDSIAESMYFGNYDVASYLLSLGCNLNNTYIIFLLMSIIVLPYYFSIGALHCFLQFSLYSSLSLFYEILFLFIFIIVL